MISVITACADFNQGERVKSLMVSLSSWLLFPVDEIVIVDWGGEIADLPTDSRIKIIRVNLSNNVWVQTVAFNLAANNAVGEFILKLDCDHVLNPFQRFFCDHPLRAGLFYRGCHNFGKTYDECALNGVLYCCKNDFFSVNGYSEMIRSYGGDDTDLYKRLKENGVEEKIIQNNSVIHLHHGDGFRNVGETKMRDLVE